MVLPGLAFPLAVLRVFRLRQTIDLAEPEAGLLPDRDDQIALEKRFCEANGLHVKDRITLAGKTLTISAIVTSPDYDTWPCRRRSTFMPTGCAARRPTRRFGRI